MIEFKHFEVDDPMRRFINFIDHLLHFAVYQTYVRVRVWNKTFEMCSEDNLPIAYIRLVHR